MKQTYPVDTDLFLAELERSNPSQSDLARFGCDRSAISRMLKGERNMSGEDQDRILVFPGVALQDVAARRGPSQSGFGESRQSGRSGGGCAYKKDAVDRKNAVDRKGEKDPCGRAVFGCVAGTLTVAPGSDLTEPMDFEGNGVTADIFTCSSFLPQLLHKDRSDRILVGAAKGNDPTIVTRDRSIYT